jgi:hypothetical protein
MQQTCNETHGFQSTQKKYMTQSFAFSPKPFADARNPHQSLEELPQDALLQTQHGAANCLSPLDLLVALEPWNLEGHSS